MRADAASRECSISAAAAATSTLSFTRQGAVSPTAAAPPPVGEAVTHGEISFMVTAGVPAAAPPTAEQQQALLPPPPPPAPAAPPAVPPAAAAGAGPRCAIPAAAGVPAKRYSEDSSVGHQGSVEHSTAFLGAQMSLDGSLVYSILGAALDARSLSSSLPGPLGSMTQPAAAAEGAAQAAAPEARVAAAACAGWLPLQMPAAATGGELARISLGPPSDTLARVSLVGGIAHTPASSGSGSGSRLVSSAFVSPAGAAAAAAAAAAELDGGSSTIARGSSPTAVAAAAAASRHDAALVGSPADGPFGTVRHDKAARPAAAAAATAALSSPSVRAAATAAAARAEEEGIGLPNGLWLQKSQSIKSSTVASVLQLLSPTKSPSTDAAAVAVSEDGADVGAAGVGSAGGSIELAAGESRSLSGSLLPALEQIGPGAADTGAAAAGFLVGDAITAAAGTEAGAGAAAAQGAVGHAATECGAAGEAAGAAGQDRGLSPSVHTRHISMMSWLQQEEGAGQATPPQPAAANAVVAGGSPVTAADAAAGEVRGSGGSTAARAISPAKDIIAAAGAHSSMAAAAERPSDASALAVTGSQSSRAVSVPGSAAAGARSRGSHPTQLWLSPGRGGRHRSSGRDGAAAPLAAPEGPGAVAAASTAAAVAVAAGGGGTMERSLSAADSSVEFYVGSFWSPVGLAARADARAHQLAGASGGQRGLQQQLARSTSSMGRLDSLQDGSLICGSLSTAAELDFAAATGSSLPGQDSLTSPGDAETQPTDRCRRCCSSGGGGGGGGGGGAECCSSGGAVGQRDRVSKDEGEGLLEGCLPAD